MLKRCARCPENFESGRGRPAKLCPRCRRLPPRKPCAWCGGPVKTKRRDAQYCSKKHQMQAFRHREAQTRAFRHLVTVTQARSERSEGKLGDQREHVAKVNGEPSAETSTATGDTATSAPRPADTALSPARS